ncbi:hypothetical protein [Pseudomonas sp. 008]|uniref:hypothetical protein n=1 Tax=Pseudomonas sp. 008 TaxID=2803906 RepID=UPI0019508861|nr:hypothetical protein [Pseudomonas sp. 008]GID03289.1 hypothetical protein TMM008_04910 [Pseudomonas sp. 008]
MSADDAQYQSLMYVLQEECVDGDSNFEQVDSFTVLNLQVGHAMLQLGEVGEVFLTWRTCSTAIAPTAPATPCGALPPNWA